MKIRSLKVEMAGDPYYGKTHPKIRLQGKWLSKLGFNPDHRVLVIPGPVGELTLRVQEPAATPDHEQEA